MRGVNDVGQTELQAAEPLRLMWLLKSQKGYTSSSIDQILSDWIQAGDTAIHSEICMVMYSIWNKEELLQQWKE